MSDEKKTPELKPIEGGLANKSQREQDEAIERELMQRVAKLSKGADVQFSKEEMDYLLQERDFSFFGDSCDLQKVAKWNSLVEIVKEFSEKTLQKAEIEFLHPDQTRRVAHVRVTLGSVVALTDADADILGQMFSAAERVYISTLGGRCVITFSISDIWRDTEEEDWLSLDDDE